MTPDEPWRLDLTEEERAHLMKALSAANERIRQTNEAWAQSGSTGHMKGIEPETFAKRWYDFITFFDSCEKEYDDFKYYVSWRDFIESLRTGAPESLLHKIDVVLADPDATYRAKTIELEQPWHIKGSSWWWHRCPESWLRDWRSGPGWRSRQ